MIDQFIPEHHIQKHILGVLMHMKYARFRDMRPPKVDTNLYTYHLNILKKRGFIIKTDDGYCLGREGLSYVDRVSIKSLKIRTQPKIITMIVVQNANGDVLLQRRTKQPHIDTWTLPYGKLHIDSRYSALPGGRRARNWRWSSCHWCMQVIAIFVYLWGRKYYHQRWRTCFMVRLMKSWRVKNSYGPARIDCPTMTWHQQLSKS